MAPPAAAAALLYAVVKSPCAVWATASPAWVAPVITAGAPKPVTALPDQTPTSPPTWVAVPATLVTVEPAKIPKVHAAPKARAEPPPGGGQAAEVVNVQTKLAASPLPKVSCAPVVIVAVKAVHDARAPAGVKVATSVAAT